jgi:hypothetical protein
MGPDGLGLAAGKSGENEVASGMKHLLLIIALLLPLGASAQKVIIGQESLLPFKKANVILATTPDSAKTALRKMAVIMQQKGFIIDRLDYDLLSISTKPHAFQSSVYTMVVLAVWESGHLKFMGQWRGQALGMTVEEDVAFTNPASKKAFSEMQNLALAYPNAKVTYMQQP